MPSQGIYFVVHFTLTSHLVEKSPSPSRNKKNIHNQRQLPHLYTTTTSLPKIHHTAFSSRRHHHFWPPFPYNLPLVSTGCYSGGAIWPTKTDALNKVREVCEKMRGDVPGGTTRS